MRAWLVLLLAAAGPLAAEELEQRFDSDVLVVESSTACYRFDVYLALSREQQARGLMYVRDLPEMTGMLFVHSRSSIISMWMRNTYIPLDIAFARDNGEIVNIAENTEPLSQVSIRAAAPVIYALELNAGTAARLGIEAGSRIIWEPPLEAAGEQ